jgi:hypothetical protein
LNLSSLFYWYINFGKKIIGVALESVIEVFFNDRAIAKPNIGMKYPHAENSFVQLPQPFIRAFKPENSVLAASYGFTAYMAVWGKWF